MNEPWFDANAYAWIPGAALGVLGGLLGTLMGVFGPRGRAPGLLRGVFAGGIVLCGALALAGIAALLLGQPYGVWYGLGFPGLLGLAILLPLRTVLRRTQAAAEARRMEAQDLA